MTVRLVRRLVAVAAVLVALLADAPVASATGASACLKRGACIVVTVDGVESRQVTVTDLNAWVDMPGVQNYPEPDGFADTFQNGVSVNDLLGHLDPAVPAASVTHVSVMQSNGRTDYLRADEEIAPGDPASPFYDGEVPVFFVNPQQINYLRPARDSSDHGLLLDASGNDELDFDISTGGTMLATSISASDTTPAVKQLVTFTATVTPDPGDLTYTWTFGDGTATTTTPTVTHKYVSGGSDDASVSVENTADQYNGRSAILSISVHGSQPAPPPHHDPTKPSAPGGGTKPSGPPVGPTRGRGKHVGAHPGTSAELGTTAPSSPLPTGSTSGSGAGSSAAGQVPAAGATSATSSAAAVDEQGLVDVRGLVLNGPQADAVVPSRSQALGLATAPEAREANDPPVRHVALLLSVVMVVALLGLGMVAESGPSLRRRWRGRRT